MARTKPHPNLQNPTPLFPLPLNTSPIIRTGQSAVIYHIPTHPPPAPNNPSPSPYKTTIQLPKPSSWTSGLHFHATHTEYIHLVQGAVFLRLNTKTYIISAAHGGIMHNPQDDTSSLPRGLIIKIPKFARHNWGRADFHLRRRNIGAPRSRSRTRDDYPRDIDDDVIVEEWTIPSDTGKPVFFWNLNGVVNGSVSPSTTSATAIREQSNIQIAGQKILGPDYWIELQLFLLFWELDNFPIFLDVGGEGGEGERGFGWIRSGVETAVSYFVLFWTSLVARMLGLEAVSVERTPGDLWEAWRRERNVGNKKDD